MLSWYKRFLSINPRYRTRVDRIEPVGDNFSAALDTRSGATTETVRKIIWRPDLPAGAAGSSRTC